MTNDKCLINVFYRFKIEYFGFRKLERFDFINYSLFNSH